MTKNKWIKKGDRVQVIAGNEKGATGTVLARRNDRVVVEGLNKRKKHVKRSQTSQSAQILEFEAPMHISNVRICDQDDNPLRLKVKLNGESKDLVYVDASGKEVVYRTVKKRVK